MSYSQGLIVNVNKLNAEEAILVMLMIEHPFLTAPVRLVNDSKEIVFNSFTHLPMPFRLKRQDDIKGELPQLQLIVPNVGRGMVKWIDGSGGGKDAKLTVYLGRRSAPSVIEEQLVLKIQSTDINTQTITFNLVVQNNLAKRSMRFTYDTKRAQGLF